MIRPLVPRGWKTTNAIIDAKKKATAVKPPVTGGKQYPIFNGAQNNKRNKKRPITLAEKA